MKKELAMKKKHAIKILLNPKSWIATENKSRMVTRWTHEEEFECESDTECFTTEDLSEAVNWLYAEQDPYREESKPESEVEFSAEASVQVTDEYIERVKREAQVEVLKEVKAFHDREAKHFGAVFMGLLKRGRINDEYKGLTNAHSHSSLAVQGLIDEIEKKGN